MTDDDPGFFMTAQEIYERIIQGPGVRTLGFNQEITFDEWRNESDRAERIRSVANTIRTGWQGDASGAAYGAAMPLAESALQGAGYLQNSHDLLTAQSESFHRVHGEVRPVPSKPPEGSLDEKFPFDVDTDKEVAGYQSDVEHNFTVFGKYDDASRYNETNMPQEYHTTSRSGGDVSVKAPQDTIEVEQPEPGPGGPRSGGPGDFGGPGSSGGPGKSSGDTSFPSGPSTGGLPGGVTTGGAETSPNEFRPSPGATSPPGPSSYSQVGPSPVSGGFGEGVPVGGYSGQGFGPRGSGGGGGGGSAGGGPGGGVRGGGLAPGAGAGAGALAAEQAAARRAAQAAAAGAKSGPMGAPVGHGRNKDDEDTEHQRKVLIEADAEDVFGSDVLTAPQVIGDDEYED